MAAHLLLIQVGRGLHQREGVAAAPRHERPYDVRVQLGATLLQELPGALGVEASSATRWSTLGGRSVSARPASSIGGAVQQRGLAHPGSTDQPGDARSPRVSVRQ